MALSPPSITLLPAGLLDYFQLKTGGQLPNQMASFIQPTLDMWPWFADANKLHVQETIAVPVVGDNQTQIDADEGKVIILHAVSMLVAVTAANYYTGLSLWVVDLTVVSRRRWLAGKSFTPPTAAGRQSLGWNGQVVLNANEGLFVVVEGIAGVAPAIDFDTWYNSVQR